VTIVGRTIIQIDNIDFFKFAPLHSLPVQFGYPVGREVSDFYLDVVFFLDFQLHDLHVADKSWEARHTGE